MKDKLKKAFIDATLDSAQSEIDAAGDLPRASAAHIAAMGTILQGNRPKSPKRDVNRRAAVLLVATIVAILSSCAAAIYHFVGTGLSVRVMTDYHQIIATAPEGSPEFIQSLRLPRYIPEQYHLTTEINSTALVSRIYHNADGKYLEFIQSTVSSTSKTENNHGTFDVIKLADREVLRYRSDTNGFIYRFADEYNFYLHTSTEFDLDTLDRIFRSIPAK